MTFNDWWNANRPPMDPDKAEMVWDAARVSMVTSEPVAWLQMSLDGHAVSVQFTRAETEDGYCWRPLALMAQ